MRENPLVCVEMDELTSHGQWATLIVFGKYEELPNTAEHQAARDVAEKLFQQHPMWWGLGAGWIGDPADAHRFPHRC